ncbi:MAG: RlmE family RNA methyltransferase [archaeon]
MKVKDKFTVKAKKEGYKARSVYKLSDINSKYQIVKRNSRVLDLGCWPGSWMQYCLNLGCDVTGVDLKGTRLKGIAFIKGNIFDKAMFDKLLGLGKFDAVLSDMAPKTTGIKNVDQARSIDLCYRALYIARYLLKNNGDFICKIFQSDESSTFVNEVQRYFSFVKITKPMASKKRSGEIYLIAKGLKSIQTL